VNNFFYHERALTHKSINKYFQNGALWITSDLTVEGPISSSHRPIEKILSQNLHQSKLKPQMKNLFGSHANMILVNEEGTVIIGGGNGMSPRAYSRVFSKDNTIKVGQNSLMPKGTVVQSSINNVSLKALQEGGAK
jgi:hypothetical protein